MKTRILSGLIMLPLLLVVFFGGYVLMAACFLIGAMGVHEFYKGFETTGAKPSRLVAGVSIILLYGINILTNQSLTSDSNITIMGWIFLVVLMSFLYLFKINEREIKDAMVTMTGIFYVVFFSYHVILVDQLMDFSKMVWLILLTAFGTDIMAYFTGMLLGKHKLCPNISPKKTIEGSIGGILGSMILCGVFGYFVLPQLIIHCLIIGFLGGIISQFGDLTASIFKRKLGIKDYGNLIPGHGGILDRFDSVLFTAPMVYYYIIIICNFNLV